MYYNKFMLAWGQRLRSLYDDALGGRLKFSTVAWNTVRFQVGNRPLFSEKARTIEVKASACNPDDLFSKMLLREQTCSEEWQRIDDRGRIIGGKSSKFE